MKIGLEHIFAHAENGPYSMNEIRNILSRWYQENKRDLPWRQTKNPYTIWLSEIILQQTRVEQGMPYFIRFSEAFPTVATLASAEEDTVLKLWQGLGYYSRARNLQAAARQVMKTFDGVFPTNYDDLIRLKGVGPYTAAAIASIAYQEPKAVVDGNVIRVISRLFGIAKPVNETAVAKRIATLAQSLLDEDAPGEHNQAMMEFGALQCVPQNPKCTACPLQQHCEAYRLQLVTQVPHKNKKTKRRSRYLHFFVATSEDHVLIEKRGANDIWAGLYQFPLIETENTDEIAFDSMEKALGCKIETVTNINPHKKHVLSHQDLHATFYHIKVKKPYAVKFEAVHNRELHTFALPRLIDRYLENHDLESGMVT